jgi:hypothetical protein
MNSTYQLAALQSELDPLKEFIKSYVDYQANIKIGSDYPTKLLRFNEINQRFTPAYFNIDAILEKLNLHHSLYNNEANLYNELSQKHNVTFRRRLLKKEEHVSEINRQIRLRDRERLAENIEEAEIQLREWLKTKDASALDSLCKNSNKKLEIYFNTFKKLYPYIDSERLLQDLKEVTKDRRELRNYVNAAIFFALQPSHPFKSHVLSKFNYYEIEQKRNQRRIGIITSAQKQHYMKEIFNMQFKMSNINSDTLAEYFSCFFEKTRSGRNDKILGLNPKGFPTAIKYIEDTANPMDLFIFPND